MFACIYAPGNLGLSIDCAAVFSPHVEEDAAGAVIFDVRGLESLYGPPESLARAIEHRAGIPARIAIASNPDAALHAARGFEGVTVIERGQEAAALAPLPLNLIGASAEAGEVLHMWGIRTFGELAKLPPLGVAARLGDEGVRLQRLARGENDRQLRPIAEPLIFREEMELEHPIELLEPLLFVISRMLHEVCGRLAARALATNEIRLEFGLEREGAHRASLKMPVPTLGARALLRLLQLELNGRPPAAAIIKVALEAMPVKPRMAQHGLFMPVAPAAEKLEVTLARLRALVGEAFVGAAIVLDSFRPDRYAMAAFSPSPEVRLKPAGAANGPEHIQTALILRRFRPPVLGRVITKDERPVHLTATAAQGAITTARGPWRSSGEWWRADAWDRDFWDVEVAGGGLHRLFLDNFSRHWFVEGSYD